MANRLKLIAVTLLLFVSLSFSFERTAHAYVDPGSSLLVFQSVSAIVSGVLFYFRRRLKGLFTRSDKQAVVAPLDSSSGSRR